MRRTRKPTTPDGGNPSGSASSPTSTNVTFRSFFTRELFQPATADEMDVVGTRVS